VKPRHAGFKRLESAVGLAFGAAQRGSEPLAIIGLKAWCLREPDSGRRYTIVRVDSQGGLSGYGEGGPAKPAEIAEAKAAITGLKATALEFVRHRFAAMPALEAAISNAQLDLAARSAKLPVYLYLGGPTRFKVRLMARLPDNALATPDVIREAKERGLAMFTLRVTPREPMSRLQAWVDAARRNLEEFKKIAGADAEVVLDGGGALLPGDAAVVARSLEKEHPIWFDEPANVLTTDALSRITDESVLPLGLGRGIHDISAFQNFLRWGCGDVLRPNLAINSVHKVRRIAAIAETHYIAVAPYHDGGTLATIMGIHLAASIPNAYVQEVPIPASARDRAMRAEVLGGMVERAQSGFAPLINQPGLGVRPDEQVLNRYSEETL
jgi:galactonate dehydratase